MNDKQRIDLALTERGLAASREKAQALIMSGCVYIREQKVLKPSEKVSPEDELTVKGPEHPYVGRGALKLEKALQVFNVRPQGMDALDIGAATGGFSDVLLQNGARHVFAIDVGYGQLDWKIRNDPRVTVMERTNARYLQSADIGGAQPDITVMDVSFISVKLILPVAAKLMAHQGVFCILIKPQFEAGRENVGKKGVVRDPAVHEAVVRSVRDFAPEFGYRMSMLDYSPIKGPEGNIEYIARLDPAAEGEAAVTDAQIAKAVAEAHGKLDKTPIE
ncbi:MAG TPA: TlyA family RNA methyltransferase [Candidatus Limiplasma sp.]|nr:TlyA family RNA methyltransferase [Candidatus Limiplasma sp.]HPS81335.1 TlyA family RNA methyltransferase [Candidatus Limiplasma sp.]